MAMYIKTWDELRQITNESDTHVLKIGKDSAWIKAKDKRNYDETIDYMEQVSHLDVYLSTHTFYASNYKFSSKLLQKCGFDVELSNWDEEEPQNIFSNMSEKI